MKFLGIIIIPAELGLCPDLGRIICDKRDIMVQMSQNEKHFLKQQYRLCLMQRQLKKLFLRRFIHHFKHTKLNLQTK